MRGMRSRGWRRGCRKMRGMRSRGWRRGQPRRHERRGCSIPSRRCPSVRVHARPRGPCPPVRVRVRPRGPCPPVRVRVRPGGPWALWGRRPLSASAPWGETEVCLRAVRTSDQAPADWRDAAGPRRCLPPTERQARLELLDRRRPRKRRGDRRLARRHSPSSTPRQWIRRRRIRPRRAWPGDKRSILRAGPSLVPVPRRGRRRSIPRKRALPKRTTA